MPRIPPLGALRAFEAAARHSSFSKAADELCVTHSAISHQIKQLEAWIGLELFVRTGRGVSPTPESLEFSRLVSECFSRISDASARLCRFGSNRTVNVAAIPSFATRWIIPRLPGFQQENPDVDILVSYSPPHFTGDLSGFDVLITYYDGPYTGELEVKRLMSGALRPVCSPSYLRSHGPIRAPSDIASATFIHDDVRTTWRDWLTLRGVDSSCAESGTVFADFNLLSIAAIAGHGVALCPTELIRGDLQAGHLVQLLDDSILDDRNYVLFVRPSAAPAVQTFCDWLVLLTHAGHCSSPRPNVDPLSVSTMGLA